MREYKYTVTNEDVKEQLQVKTLLRRNFSFSSRLRTKIKKNKSVFLNDKPAISWAIPSVGDELVVKIPEETSHFIPERIPFTVIFEDEDFLIVNKPAGYVVHPTNGHPIHTIANGVAQYMIDTNQTFKIRFINRLDMDTSGILVLGKNSHAQDDYSKQMKHNQVHKGYLAVVKGIIEENEGTIDLPIGRPNPDEVRRSVMEDGRPSITHYRVIERYDKGYTLVRLKLETGRTHQIRVHMSHIGYPIAGDYLYGGDCIHLIERQALHAESLSFYHPATGKHLELNAEIPNDIRDLLKKIK